MGVLPFFGGSPLGHATKKARRMLKTPSGPPWLLFDIRPVMSRSLLPLSLTLGYERGISAVPEGSAASISWHLATQTLSSQ